MEHNPIRVGGRGIIVRDGKILLVEFNDESGLHYNFPGGGIQTGESIPDGVKREVFEETNAVVEVGRLLLVYEVFPPHYRDANINQHKLGMLFECRLAPGSEPRLPDNPDENQTAVKWVPLESLHATPILPAIPNEIMNALKSQPAQPIFLKRI